MEGSSGREAEVFSEGCYHWDQGLREPGHLRQAVVHPLLQLPRPRAQPEAPGARRPHRLGTGLLCEVQVGSALVLLAEGWAGGGHARPAPLQTAVMALGVLRAVALEPRGQ